MAVGNQTPPSVATDYAALVFAIRQQLSLVSTMTLARVVSCTNEGGIVPAGTLTVQPLVNMLSGDGVAFPHKELYNVPYMRLQGGANAVIMDPQPGDVGLIGFCERDISVVKKTKAMGNPGSARKFSKSDGVWIATVWAAQAPAQYIVMTDEGVTVVSPTAITLQAPVINLRGEVVQEDGDVSMSQALDVQGQIHSATDVVSDNISGKTHTHTSAAPGNPTSAPLP
jgi:hypothetical protein